MDIGATKVALALVDAEGTILAHAKVASADIFRSCSTAVASLAEIVAATSQRWGVGLSGVEGIGIGIPGAVDGSSGLVAYCPNLSVLVGLPLGQALQEQVGIPVFVENDVNLICLGESRAGRGKGVNHVACVFVGTGIGCGLVLDGRLYSGPDGTAGEIGHTVIEPNGRPCNCGGRGCLEMYCSGKALALRAAAILGGEPSPDMSQVRWTDAELLINAAKAGHAAARAELEQAFYYLGLGVANLVNVINPRLVILGGGIGTAWPDGIEIVRRVVCTRALPLARDRVVIERPGLGDRAGLVGAAFLVRDRLGG